MNTIMEVKEAATDVLTHTSSTDTPNGKNQRPKYLDKEYIVRAREAEVKHHLHSIGQLQKKMEKLASELAWELEQHHSKIHELYQLEAPFQNNHDTTTGQTKSNKKAAQRRKSTRTFDIPLLGESICETFA